MTAPTKRQLTRCASSAVMVEVSNWVCITNTENNYYTSGSLGYSPDMSSQASYSQSSPDETTSTYEPAASPFDDALLQFLAGSTDAPSPGSSSYESDSTTIMEVIYLDQSEIDPRSSGFHASAERYCFKRAKSSGNGHVEHRRVPSPIRSGVHTSAERYCLKRAKSTGNGPGLHARGCSTWPSRIRSGFHDASGFASDFELRLSPTGCPSTTQDAFHVVACSA